MMRGRLAWGLVAVLILLAVVEATIAPHPSPRFPWHYVPGYAALIGVGSCIGVVLLSKALGRWFLQRPERHDE